MVGKLIVPQIPGSSIAAKVFLMQALWDSSWF